MCKRNRFPSPVLLRFVFGVDVQSDFVTLLLDLIRDFMNVLKVHSGSEKRIGEDLVGVNNEGNLVCLVIPGKQIDEIGITGGRTGAHENTPPKTAIDFAGSVRWRSSIIFEEPTKNQRPELAKV
ncbi:unnamed protein product [Lactuca saligna]|uniref:Uncharacterized protein n=1 Tax=Lactuca saligna TaxID=75948 RepID=A0AA35ZMV3_LACSI|nr:unnamed protein product [Lactuca saligna]